MKIQAKKLTPKQGYEQSRERYGAFDEEHLPESGECLCEDCGCTKFLVEENKTRVLRASMMFTCNCEDGQQEDLEATCTITKQECHLFELRDDHNIGQRIDVEKLEDDQIEFEGLEGICPDCHSDPKDELLELVASGDCEERDEHNPDDKFYVRCSQCKREILFGWSHPGRGGRVWPCESSDYNPRLAWLEPRYLNVD